MNADQIMFGINWTIQIVGLLSVWKQERKGTSDDKFQDFMIWLQTHNFNELSERIYQSEEVQRELNSLLSQSIDQIDKKLDAIASSISKLLIKIDGLSLLDRAVSRDSKTISTQAREILKLFADRTEDTEMLLKPWGNNCVKILMFIPSGTSFTMDEPRFLDADVSSLVDAGLIFVSRYDGDGDSYYSLSRSGAKLAQDIPPVEIKRENPKLPFFA